MPSLIPGFEYDIFISYRQKDNKGDRWVTEFVKALRTELDSTFKEDISIYFDENPHDGLLETHQVDKSLEGKLKCLVFIPIISQTYCDPKSFAWQHEFCSFNKLAKEDGLGRDIKLSNGNVASRILPIRIHELDVEDKATIEQEMGGALRAVDFIFKSSGVNRPLTPADKRDENLNRSFYRDQVNKVANAIKEIASGIKSTNQPASSKISLHSGVQKKSLRKTVLALAGLALLVSSYFLYNKFGNSNLDETIDKSIAVLPFVDMSPGHDQEYLGDGIAEDIITALSKIKDLKVIGRTSSFQFKGEKGDLREIGDKLNVATLLEGSVAKSGNKVRITAQLIDTNDGSHIWAEQYERSMDDIFSIKDDISRMIAAKMKITILGNSSEKKPTENIEAYENVLYGMQLMNRGFDNAKAAIPFFERATQLDSNYVAAYEQMAVAYFFSPLGNAMPTKEAVKKVKHLVQVILKMDANSYAAHNLLFNVSWFYEWDWGKAQTEYELVKVIDDKPDVGYALYRYHVYNDFKASEAEFLEVINLNPLNREAFRLLGILYGRNQQPVKAIQMLNRGIQIDPTFGPTYDARGQVYLSLKEYQQALDNFEKGAQLSRNRDVSKTIMALMKLGKEKEAVALFNSTELDSVSAGAHAQRCFAVGKTTVGFEWLEKAFDNREPTMIEFRFASEFDYVRNDPRFIAIINRMKLPK